ncbi:MAG: hypothetical protein KFF73_04105 [Cyclobacteriaceae bacterium]|nr:hypothetical protein [Cyclobacteriaceae bacterium]
MISFIYCHKRWIIALIYLVIMHLNFSAAAQQDQEDPEVYDEWRLKRDKDGIRIYTRWIEAEEGRKARQMHAVMQVEASLDASVLALTDEKQVKIWLNRVKEYDHFDEKDKYHWYAYTQFRIPWPLNNQDLITFNTLQQDRETSAVQIKLEGRPDDRPEENGVQRIPHFDGAWHFTPLADGRVQIEYYIFTKSKPVMPRWIIDPIVESGLWSTFADMQRVILENEANNVKLTFLSD